MVADPRKLVIHVSLAVSIVMLVGKLTAYFVTNSTALLADAAESVVHGAATGLAAFSLWLSARPADESHPYGHGRIAYFSAGFEGGLICLAALLIVYEGVQKWRMGLDLENIGLGTLLVFVMGNGVAILIRRRESL